MATVSRSVVTLRVTGDSLEPELVAQALGHEPSSAQKRGETLVGKKTGVSRVARFGMWRIEAAAREPGDFDAQIEEILSKLTPDLGVWRLITSTYTTDLFCGLFLNRSNEGINLSPTSLAALGSRGIEFGLDIYSGADEGDA